MAAAIVLALVQLQELPWIDKVFPLLSFTSRFLGTTTVQYIVGKATYDGDYGMYVTYSNVGRKIVL